MSSKKITEEQRKRYQELVNQRRVIGGEKSELMAISPVKHAWARAFWRQMLDNTWFPTEVDMSRDIACYQRDLSEGEKQAFDYALAFLSNLDGIQLHNITDNIAQHITSPEIKMVTTRQAFEEALHVDAYSTIIETVSADPMSVYMTFERDGMLARKNEFILRQSKMLGTEFSPRSFALACVANVALEGIYFYSGFLTFYALAKRGKMTGSADQIKFINRDEVAHLNFFLRMLEEVLAENPGVADEQFWKDAEEIIRSAVELEIGWGCYIISGGVLGLSDQIVADYIKHLANLRWAKVRPGAAPLYPGVKNPVEWVEKFSSINGEESNFFEAKVKSYQVGGTLSDWD